MSAPAELIRPYRESDEAAVVKVWYRAGRATYDFLPQWCSLTFDQAVSIFRETIRPHSEIWVGAIDGTVTAYLALRGSYLDRLYVDPAHWRREWGTRLLTVAKARSPAGLELHTHRDNTAACAFYEKHDFVAVGYGVSPPPESIPDVEYHWRPPRHHNGVAE